MSSAPVAPVAPIVVTIDEPSKTAWGSAVVAKMLAIDGVVSVTIDPAVPSRIVCVLPGDVGVAKPLINQIAYAVPGVPLQWSSRAPVVV